ncbi:TadE family type IV pilus minor pilin [Nonomuraea roseoviolacea]|uniref:TadE family type IV pilus minor pilin n=1 Tax=Nonomuraea roseoviolacea TaxID=103837 RepID=UPI0027E22E2A|nr:TadE family type IV pilus minor pilin [Nonomuraea roseoviolacea]
MTLLRSSAARRFRRSRCRGSVTAETAAVLPALMVVLAAALWAIQAVGTQLECVDAARVGARAAARGEPVDQVREVIRSATRPDARVEVLRGPERTHVKVAVDVRPAWGAAFPPVQVSATASAATEN